MVLCLAENRDPCLRILALLLCSAPLTLRPLLHAMRMLRKRLSASVATLGDVQRSVARPFALAFASRWLRVVILIYIFSYVLACFAAVFEG